MIRVIQQADARKQESARAIPSTTLRTGPKSCGFEAATRHLPAKKKGDLKKQSQFAAAHLAATSFMQEDYNNNPTGGAEENKANKACPERSRMGQFPAPALTKGAGKREKSLAAANSLTG